MKAATLGRYRVTGQACPWMRYTCLRHRAKVGKCRVAFKPGAFDPLPVSVPVLREHDHKRQLGRATPSNGADGLQFTAWLERFPDDARQISIGYYSEPEWQDAGDHKVALITKAELLEISVVPAGSFGRAEHASWQIEAIRLRGRECLRH